MFPAPAGMNRRSINRKLLVPDVPRACGDEPDAGDLTDSEPECSPRLRG